MKRYSEKLIDRKLRLSIKKLKGKYIKLATNLEAGLPDRLCLLPRGRIYFVETKSTGDNPSRIQRLQHSRITKLGFQVLIIDTPTKVEDFILKITTE